MSEKKTYKHELLFKRWDGEMVAKTIESECDVLSRALSNHPDRDFSGVQLPNASLSLLDRDSTAFSGANFEGADLRYASLLRCSVYGANFKRANLCGANLRFVHATCADFKLANLSHANLTRGNFSCVNFTDADLSYTSCDYANFRDAIFTNATINWSQHDLVAELTRQAAESEKRVDPAKLMVAGLILVQRDWCWDDFFGKLRKHALFPWFMDNVVARYHKPDDGLNDLADTYLAKRVKSAERANRKAASARRKAGAATSRMHKGATQAKA